MIINTEYKMLFYKLSFCEAPNYFLKLMKNSAICIKYSISIKGYI